MDAEFMKFAEAQIESMKQSLHPDLLESVYEDETFGESLKHPLVFQVPLIDKGLANRLYEQKLAQVANLIALGTDSSLKQSIWLHERPYRVQTLLIIADYLSDKAYWEAVREVWMDSENTWQNPKEWEQLFSCERTSKENLMTEDDRKAYEALPDRVPIYRGFKTRVNPKGLSWTTNLDTANFFAYRFGFEGNQVKHAVVDKESFVAYFTGRNEFEAILLPEEEVENNS